MPLETVIVIAVVIAGFAAFMVTLAAMQRQTAQALAAGETL